MAHHTRSGKAFKYVFAEQSSPWGEASEVLMVLLDFLDFSTLLEARLVCQAWRSSFNTPVKQLQLEQPTSARAAYALGRKAAAAFSNATIVCLKLLKVQDPPIDLTADEGQQPELFGPDSLGRPAAGAALLRQLSKAARLQHLLLVADISHTCTCLPALLKAVPQLLVLDLSCCSHNPADLLLVAHHAPGLQELLLHCQAFTTLSGRRIRHGNPEWGRHGGNTRYQPEHIAALARLPQLQLLECAMPSSCESEQLATYWFNAVGSLTSLTALHVIRHGQFDARPPATTLTALSRLARLRALRCDAGGRASLPAYYVSHSEQAASGDESAQAKCWGTVLPCMPYLTRLELLEVAVGDTLLCAVGSNAPQLQRLVLQRALWLSGTSEKGADASVHIGHIELLSCNAQKTNGFNCSQHLQLLQLPGVKRCNLCGLAISIVDSSKQHEGSIWSPEMCKCTECGDWQNGFN